MKDFVNRIASAIRKVINRPNDHDKLPLLSYTPKNDVSLEPYANDLYYAFSAADASTKKIALNIAFFGSSGTGKSSVIETYEKKCGGKKFLHIFLGRYDSPAEREVDRETVMEGLILNQLIHQIKPTDIPETRFRIRRDKNPNDIVNTVVMAVTLVFAVIHIIKFTAWQNYVKSLSIIPIQKLLGVTAANEAPLFSGIIAVLLTGVFIYKLLKYSHYQDSIKRVSVQGNEIELSSDAEDSYFDKYFNEVCYLFEKTDADVIVFENIGEHFPIQTLQRLKNINTQVNRRRQNRPLRFLYLLPADMIDREEKGKLFDFDFPVRKPNTSEWISKYEKLSSLFVSGEQNFLQDIAALIDDMRILIATTNDFFRYKKDLSQGYYNKLFTMMAYKNFFPKDYQLLCNKSGFLYCLFSKRSELLQAKIDELDKTIESLEQLIQAAKSEPMRSYEELEWVYAKRIEQLPPSQINAEEIKNLSEEKERRYKNIENQSVLKFKALKSEVRETRKTKEQLTSCCSVVEMFDHFEINDVFHRIQDGISRDSDVSISVQAHYDLLKYFIQNGLIDETYIEYIFC